MQIMHDKEPVGQRNGLDTMHSRDERENKSPQYMLDRPDKKKNKSLILGNRNSLEAEADAIPWRGAS